MVIVSTKTGDKGQTALADGRRLSKADQYFATIGTLDELNSWLGLVVTKFDTSFHDQHQFLLYIQHQLFVVGGELAQFPKTRVSYYFLKKIEAETDKLQNSMKKNWHTKFLLPGGTELAAWIDITRSVNRRFERQLVALADTVKVRPVLLKSTNRLSDYLYVLRCFVNHRLQYGEKKFGR